MEVSTEEVFEITDTSIANLADKTAIETSKRPYSPDIENEEDKEVTAKKFKEDSKNETENDGVDVTESINATGSEKNILNVSQEISIEEDPLEETSVLDKTNESESMLEELVSDGEEKDTTIDDEEDDEIVAGNGRAVDSESDEDIEEEMEDEESENSSGEDEDDDALMKRAVNASKSKPMMSFDEPIALDSTDESDGEENEDIEEQKEDVEDQRDSYGRINPVYPMSLKARLLRLSPRFYLAKKLVKRSIKIINSIPATKSAAEGTSSDKNEEEKSVEDQVTEILGDVMAEILETKEESTEKVEEVPQKDATQELPKEQEKELPQVNDEPMQVDEKPAESKQSDVIEEKPTSDEKKTNDESKVENNFNADESSQAQEVFDQECDEINFLLTEISKSSIDEILSRYVLNSNDNNSSAPPAMEDFTEKLFICLQQNKHDIQKAQQVWNEKLHIKYKIRELMERMRRHRVVVDIENFGYKPIHDNPIISSKSSTTNSDNDHLLEKSSRMSTESVSRLIQDVRANVLKRDEKQNHIESSFDESNPFANLTPNQGRRGQIIDVQSIVNDFRQKNPQEIPRRGRRFKNSFGGNSSMMESQRFSPYPRVDANQHKSNNSPGFPEVSLLPVNSFYKSLPQPTGTSPYGQKSSLLQSILTKSTKSPIGLQHMNNSSGTSSTLARLLTAPERERTLQQHNSTPRQMNMGGPSRQSNGEITITPIQPGTSRKQEYMDEEENSTDGHLVIDESDFDLSERKSDLLLCQGCRRHKALFMCAGCSKQWYCSKECQEIAWDEHAELCMG